MHALFWILLLAVIRGAEATSSSVSQPTKHLFFTKVTGIRLQPQTSSTISCPSQTCSAVECAVECMKSHGCAEYSHSPFGGLCVLGELVLYDPMNLYVPDPAWNTFKSGCPIYAGYSMYNVNGGKVCLRAIDDPEIKRNVAVSLCAEHDANLVMVKTMSDYLFLQDVVLAGSIHRYWVGAQKNQTDEQFYWLDGTLLPTSDTMWRSPSPNHNEPCVVIRPKNHDNLWGISCNWRAAVVCHFYL